MVRMPLLLGMLVIGFSAEAAAQVEKPAAKAAAKGPRPMLPPARLPSYNLVNLLEMPVMLDELKVSEEQKLQIKKATDEFLRQSEALRQARLQEAATDGGASDGPNSETQQRFAEAQFNLSKGLEEARLKILTKRQRQRLVEVQLQAQGPVAFTRPEIQEKLNMSPEQIQEITELVRQARDELASARNKVREMVKSVAEPDSKQKDRIIIKRDSAVALNGLRAKLTKDAEASRRALDSSIAKVLRKKQRDDFRKMCGEPFDVKKLVFPTVAVFGDAAKKQP